MLPIVAAVGGAAVVVAGGALSYDDHSDHYSEYTEYSDAHIRRQKEREERERQRRRNFDNAETTMLRTYHDVMQTVANEAGPENSDLFREFTNASMPFRFNDFQAEYNKLDQDVQKKIDAAIERMFAQKEQPLRKELDEVNALIREISEYRLTRK